VSVPLQVLQTTQVGGREGGKEGCVSEREERSDGGREERSDGGREGGREGRCSPAGGEEGER